MLSAGTLEAIIKPLRSKIRPRLAGNSSVRVKRTTPWRKKKSLATTLNIAARSPSTPKANPINTTNNLTRHAGVRLASKGLVE